MKHGSEYLWALVGRFLPQAIYLGTTMILSRFLSPEDFGVIGVLAVFFAIADILIDSGLGGSLIKEKSISKIDCSTILVFNIVLSLFIYFILFFISDFLEKYYEVIGLSLVCKVSSLVFVINSFGMVANVILIRQMRFHTKTTIYIFSVLLASFVSIVMAFFQFGVWALVSYQLVLALVSSIFTIKAAHYKLFFKFSWDSLHRLFSFGFFTTLTNTIDTIYENLTVNIFGKYLGVQEAGYVYQAKRIEDVASSSVAITVSNVSFPVLTKLYGNEPLFLTECKSIFKVIILILSPVLVCIALFSTNIIVVVFGHQWTPAAPYLSLLSVAGIFKIAETLVRTFIKSTSKVDKLFLYTIFKRVFGIAILFACLLLSPKIVLYGYIISTLVGFLFNIYLFSRVTSVTFFEQLFFLIKLLLPSVGLFLLSCIFMTSIEVFVYQFVFFVILLCVYYFIILRLYNIRLKDYILKYINRN